MCVAITLQPGGHLTLEEIQKMHRANADGVGLAWAIEGKVHWDKTINVDPQAVYDLVQYYSDLPRLLHFRLATAGGTKHELCHPFDISPRSICTPTGVTDRMMIHNGHWNSWTQLSRMLEDENLLPDRGPWSDSRLAAFLAHTDNDWLIAMGGKVATITGDGTIQRYGEWQELRTGIMVSNKIWDTISYKRGGYEGYRGWRGWEWDEDDFKEAAKTEKTTSLVSDLPPDKPRKTDKGKEKGKDKQNGKRRTSGDPSSGDAHWWDPKEQRWHKWDSKIRSVVDATSDHPEGAPKGDEPRVIYVSKDGPEIAP